MLEARIHGASDRGQGAVAGEALRSAPASEHTRSIRIPGAREIVHFAFAFAFALRKSGGAVERECLFLCRSCGLAVVGVLRAWAGRLGRKIV